MENKKRFLILIIVLAPLVIGGIVYYTGKNSNPSTEVISTTTLEKQIGSIKSIYQKNGKYYLDIDYVQWISNAKTCETRYGEYNNDYCIINDNSLLRTFSISNDVKVELQTYSHDVSGGYVWNQVIPLSIFATALNNSYVEMHPEYPARNFLYWITLNNGVITNIVEQYQP